MKTCKECKSQNVCIYWGKFIESIIELIDKDDYRESVTFIGGKVAKVCRHYEACQ